MTLRFFRLIFLDLNEKRTIDIYDQFETLNQREYFGSALRVLKRYGCVPNKGYHVQIHGDLAVNAGMSSSTAVIVAWARFLVEAFGVDETIDVNDEFIARVAYEAEVVEHGEPGGVMDQYAIGIGNIIYIDTGKHFDWQIIGSQLTGLVVGESGLPKETIGLLSEIKSNALASIQCVKQHHPEYDIETSSASDYELYQNEIPDHLRPYFYAAVMNYQITKKALEALKEGKIDMAYLGRLMNEHHKILKDVLKITVPLIDKMIEAAHSNGAYGAKIVGSGGGGCIVAIAPEEKKEAIIQAIKKVGAADAYGVQVSPGAQVIN